MTEGGRQTTAKRGNAQYSTLNIQRQSKTEDEDRRRRTDDPSTLLPPSPRISRGPDLSSGLVSSGAARNVQFSMFRVMTEGG
jgi:hypothetical protein